MTGRKAMCKNTWYCVEEFLWISFVPRINVRLEEIYSVHSLWRLNPSSSSLNFVQRCLCSPSEAEDCGWNFNEDIFELLCILKHSSPPLPEVKVIILLHFVCHWNYCYQRIRRGLDVLKGGRINLCLRPRFSLEQIIFHLTFHVKNS